MTNKIKDLEDHSHKYLLDEYEEDFDYNNMFDLGIDVRRSYYYDN